MREPRRRSSAATDRSGSSDGAQSVSARSRTGAAGAPQGTRIMSSVVFLNSALLWGLGLASIPLIIHLLFRRRFRQVEWAPMRYLKLTIQRNRRRIQLEQLLLLLLRTALIIVLVLLVSRPILNAAGITRWLSGETRTSHILVLDDSLSMGLSTSGRSAFQQALGLAGQAVEDVGRKD